MINKVFLVGRLVRDPENRVTASGISLSRFVIAVDKLGKKQITDGPTADFINIICWRRLADICGQYLKKGKLVAIEGRLQIDHYERDGETKEWVEVVADNVQMLDWGEPTEPIAEESQPISSPLESQ